MNAWIAKLVIFMDKEEIDLPSYMPLPVLAVAFTVAPQCFF